MAKHVYNPKQVDISFGSFSANGWDSISISRNAENTSKNISADGVVGLTKIADGTGTFEIEVQQQNSNFNAWASAIQSAQDLGETILFFDIVMSDKSGGVLCRLNSAHLDAPASQDLSGEAGSRTWVFFVEDLQYLPAPEGLADSGNSVAKAAAAVNTIKSNVLNKLGL